MMRRIMIAEDEPSILATLEFLMSNAGYQTRSVQDGREAGACLDAFRPDLLLLDVMLPGKSGLEICRELRAHSDKDLAATRVLLLTAKGGLHDVATGAEYSADDYLIKPFSTRELLGRVRKLLGEEHANGAGA